MVLKVNLENKKSGGHPLLLLPAASLDRAPKILLQCRLLLRTKNVTRNLLTSFTYCALRLNQRQHSSFLHNPKLYFRFDLAVQLDWNFENSEHLDRLIKNDLAAINLKTFFRKQPGDFL